MSQLSETEAFVVVVGEGSFAAAGERLGISSSYVSKLVSRLEDRLGVRLLHRTTRKLALTDAGVIYHDSCADALTAIAEAEASVLDLRTTARGHLRVTLPTSLGLTWLAAWLAEFALANPELSLDVTYLDRAVDLVGEGFDVALRAGTLPDSSLIGRRLATGYRAVVASPAYLARAGVPETPEQLAAHACLRYSLSATSTSWSLEAGAERRTIAVAGTMTANSGVALLEAAVSGLGLAYLPDFHVARRLAAGSVVRVLPAWSEPVPIHALYPSGRNLAKKVRVFVDGLSAYLATPPWTRV